MLLISDPTAKVESTLQVMAFCYGEMFTAYLTQATLR